LGTPIFIRNHRQKIDLTPTGKIIVNHFEKLKYEFTDLENELENYKSNIDGELRVGVLWTFSYSIVNQILNDFQKKFPSIHLHYQIGSSSQLIDKMKTNDLDLIFSNSGLLNNKKNEALFSTDVLMRSPFLVILNKNNPLSKSKKINIQQFDQQDILLPDIHTDLYSQINNLIQKSHINCKVIGNSTQPDAIIHIVKNNSGIGFLARETYDKYVPKDKNIIGIQFEPEIFRQTLLITNNQNYNHEIIQQFRNFTLKYFSN